jgi:alginate O-acetyltransferase complex protein AlgI
MIFSSNLFLYIFLPLFLAVYYATPNRFRSYTILLGSYIFYAWWRVDYLALVAGVSIVSYLASLAIAASKTKNARLAFLWLGIGSDLGALAYFKYFNFFNENLNVLLNALGQHTNIFTHVILPIGISFHVFQSVSYVIDVYRRDVPPAPRIVDFLAFTSLFPQLIAGPVLRYKDLADQFASRSHTWEKFNRGAELLAIGLAKKILIADSLAPTANAVFATTHPSFIDSWVGALAYTFQLYFDFSGYSDMAIGLGLMMGFQFIANFNDPYMSRSITEFWRRWHISLSTWLRDYLYIPLGGNKRGNLRTYINLLITMVLGGFWHGANWTFLFWGFWHGSWMAVERKVLGKASGSLFPAFIALPITFIIVVFGWVVFRAETFSSAMHMWGGLLGINGFGPSDTLQFAFGGQALCVLLIAMAISWRNLWQPPALKNAIAASWIIVPLFVLALLKLSAQNYTPFLYFQF